MNETEDIFTSEYSKDAGNQTKTSEESITPSKDEETLSVGPKYGLSKPVRRRIRGIIFHDKG